MRATAVEPMLARLARELPEGDGWAFEPKWDGFRCLAFVGHDEIDLRSRNGRPFARYFPEVVAALAALPATGIVIDGELLIREPHREFANLMARLHPAQSRVTRLAEETPAEFIAFDVVSDEPFSTRRARLERLMDRGDTLRVTPSTTDRTLAQRWLDQPPERAIDGVVAKRLDAPYAPGKRAMVKVKLERTADCVVAGFRVVVDEPLVASLLLGLYDDDAMLRHIGVVTSFRRTEREALMRELVRYIIDLDQHPWRDGFALEGGPMGRLAGAAGRWTPAMAPDWVPLQPVLVAEVAYDQVDGHRLRHPGRFRRWRPDRDARSCLTGQLA